MPFQSVPDTAEAVVRFLVNGQNCTLTFYGQRAGGYDQTAISQLAETVDDWAGSHFRPALSEQAAYTGVAVRGLESAVDFLAVNADNAGIGAVNFAPMPNVCAFAVTRISGLAGRSARGRVYWPITTFNVGADENTVAAAFRDDTLNHLNALRGDMQLATWTEVIVSRVTLGAPRPFGVTFQVLNYVSSDLNIDTQRRRAPGK